MPPCESAGAAFGGRVAEAVGVRVGVTGVCGGRVPANAVATLMNAVGVRDAVGKIISVGEMVAATGTAVAVGSGVIVAPEQALEAINPMTSHPMFANFIRFDSVLWVSVLVAPVPARALPPGHRQPIP